MSVATCIYIGETGRTLEKRLYEHRAAVKKNDRRVVSQYMHGTPDTRESAAVKEVNIQPHKQKDNLSFVIYIIAT